METGFVFSPADHELTDLYLGGQIAGHPVFSTFIHHADVYSAAPAELVAGREHVRDRDGNDACYLISRVRYASKKKKKMKLRTIDDDPSKSYWHSESGKKPVEGSAVGGYVQDFVYAIKKDGHVERLGWRMKEYGISSTEHGDGDLVLCKVYRTPRKPSTTPATSSLCDVTADTCKKRKAASSHPEDTTASARPLHTVENDEHPQPVQSPDLSDDLIMFDDGDHRGHTDSGVEIISDAVPPPSNFLCNTEQEVLSLYQNNVVTEPPCAPTAPAASNLSFDDVGQEFWGFMAGPGGYLAAPPCPPAAQPEEHAAGLVQTVTSDHRMDATSVEEEGAQPEPEFIYGLPSCPAFSPELIRRCSDDMMMPWPLSPTYTAMFWS